jgi:hypothetical protein
MYNLSLQNLGKNFISTKYNVLHEQTMPKFLTIALLTSVAKLKELNY